ncbi:MAG: DNA polymerase III subunit gamma/tau [Oscillospiraceae bacterium]
MKFLMEGITMYLALYRKYRPRTFDDVISQEHITTTLKNQIINGSAGHAYLFTGSRGTGKTTCAKILSMAVNCDNPENGSPCMKCDRCREILEGTTPDVVEMDAASNRGVEDVRRLREEVAYTPVSCKYRVYIIDEVHMLTTEAFNALLKMLEEPPPHVKFILATTELHKVPATISSRCQRFEFRRIDINDSAKRLMEVARKEGFSLDEDAAVLISRLSDGGMRDALSVLDRCASCDDHITTAVVRDCAGIADNHHLYEFSEMIAQRNTAGCIRLLGELHNRSKDIALIINNLTEHYRDLMIFKSAPQESDLLYALPDEIGRVSAIANMYSMGEVMDCLSLLSECAESIGRTKQRKTLAEMCLIKMCARGGKAPQSGESAFVQPSTVQKPTPKPAPSVEKPIEIRETAPIEEKAPAPQQPSWEEEPLPAPEPPPWDEEPLSAPEPPVPEAAPFEAPPTAFPFDEAPVETQPLPEEFAPKQTPPEFEEEPEDLAGDDYPINTENAAPVNAELKPFSVITPEQWEEALSKMDFMMSSMLRGAEIKCADGVLTVISTNPMLINNVKGEELAEYEKKISAILGMKLQLRIEKSNASLDAEESNSPADILLKKARELGVTVKIKD